MRTISPEQILADAGVQAYDTKSVGEAWATAHRELRAALADPVVTDIFCMIGVPGAGKSHWCAESPALTHAIVFDAVNSNAGRRAAMAKRITAAGRRAVAVVVHTPIGICLQRNAERPPGRRVPEAFIQRAWSELQRFPVDAAEGWDDVITVFGMQTRHDRATTQERDDKAGRVVYRWRTEEDDRVRPEHRARHGRLFAWGRPPEGGHPGESFNCRCVAEMVRDSDVVEDVNGNLRARPLTVPRWARRR